MSGRQNFRRFGGIPYRPKICCDCNHDINTATTGDSGSGDSVDDTGGDSVDDSGGSIVQIPRDLSLNSLLIEKDEVISRNTNQDNITQDISSDYGIRILSKHSTTGVNNTLSGIRFETTNNSHISAIVPYDEVSDQYLNFHVQQGSSIRYKEQTLQLGERGGTSTIFSNMMCENQLFKRSPIEDEVLTGPIDDISHHNEKAIGHKILNVHEYVTHLLPIGMLQQRMEPSGGDLDDTDAYELIYEGGPNKLYCIPKTSWLLCNGFDFSGTADVIKNRYVSLIQYMKNINMGTILPNLTHPIGDISINHVIQSGVIHGEYLSKGRFGLSGEIIFHHDDYLFVAQDMIIDHELDCYFIVGTSSYPNENGTIVIAKIVRETKWNRDDGIPRDAVFRYITYSNNTSDGASDGAFGDGAFGTNIVNMKDGTDGSFFISGIFVERRHSQDGIFKETYFVHDIKKKDFFKDNTEILDPSNLIHDISSSANLFYSYPSWDKDQFKFILSSMEMYYDDESQQLHTICTTRDISDSIQVESQLQYVLFDFSNNILNDASSVITTIKNTNNFVTNDIVLDKSSNHTMFLTGFEMIPHSDSNDNENADISYNAFIGKINRNDDFTDISLHIFADASLSNAIGTAIEVDGSNCPIIAGVHESGKGDFFLGIYDVHGRNGGGDDDVSFQFVGISAETYDIITDIAIDVDSNELVVVGNKGSSNDTNSHIVLQKYTVDSNALTFKEIVDFSNVDSLEGGQLKETIKYTLGDDNNVTHIMATSCLIDEKNHNNIITCGHLDNFNAFMITLYADGRRIGDSHYS